MSDRRIIVDLSTKKTEAGWIDLQDQFLDQALPVLFRWVGWSLLLGSLFGLQRSSSSSTILIVATVLSFGLALHITLLVSRIIIVWGKYDDTRERYWRTREKIVTALIILPLAISLVKIVDVTRDIVLEVQLSRAENPK